MGPKNPVHIWTDGKGTWGQNLEVLNELRKGQEHAHRGGPARTREYTSKVGKGGGKRGRPRWGGVNRVGGGVKKNGVGTLPRAEAIEPQILFRERNECGQNDRK